MSSLRPIAILFGTIFSAIPLYVAVCNLLGIVGKEPWMTIALFASFILCGLLSWRLFRNRTPPAEYLTEEILMERGLIDVETFTAKRAFAIEEFEDEGPHYFLELADGRVLYLSGQYLYDLEEITGVPGWNQPGRFPCAHFQVKRHKLERYIASVEPLSPYMPPEAEYGSFTDEDVDADRIPEDGNILTQPYDQLKQLFASRRADRRTK
jgi:hypothetical protein